MTMKNLYQISFLFLLLFAAVLARAQNLVPNNNFSQFRTCPSGPGEIDSCLYWHNFSTGTPDYFHVCHDTMSGSAHSFGVPVNNAGNQSSASGSYIGLHTLAGTTLLREYVRVKIPALQVGALYRVTLVISLSDICMYATRSPSVYFCKNTDTFFAVNSHLSLPAQVRFLDHGFISDKLNWTTVSDSFSADSSYTQMVIGNFSDNLGTPYETVSGTIGQSYYYIDSVAVEKIADPSYVTEIEYAASGIALSPNPSTGSFTVPLPQGGSALATITDVAGRTVSTRTITHNTPINTALPPGIYILHVTTPTGSWRSKLVIQ